MKNLVLLMLVFALICPNVYAMKAYEKLCKIKDEKVWLSVKSKMRKATFF